MHIRQMNGGDVATVLAIEERSLSAWNRQQISSELQRRCGIALVAVAPDGEVRAWCCGLQTDIDAELLKITVGPEVRRSGIGRALLQEFCSIAKRQGAEQIFLEVRSQNHPALRLYEQHGFLKTGRRKDYYKEPVDDAVMYVLRLNDDPE